MTSDETPWAGLEDVVHLLGQSWVETRFTAWLLLEVMPELEADPSVGNWERAIPLQQHLFAVGARFELAAQQLLASGEERVEVVTDAVNEMRRTLIAETEWCGARMRLLTERACQPAWPFPFHIAIR